jgi:NAD(P)-dependent dehydrogenase (short-subunit alcohol dehydrogenase family)
MTDAGIFSVAGQVVVVTGAFGQLGSQYSAALLGAGASVAVLDSRAGSAELPPVLAGWRDDERMLALTSDVTDRASLEDALAAVRARLGEPTGLVNNAALDSPPEAPPSESGPFETYPEASLDAVLAVNVKGVVLCCQVFGGAMAAAGGGAIVNISSTYGLVSPDQRVYEDDTRDTPFFKPVAYSVSKSALLNLTRYLATYWAGQGVRVNTLTLAGVRRDQPAAFMDKYTSRVPLGRMAEEDEYNGAVIFLLSPASAYMTGSNLVVDGGWTAW